MVRGIAALFEVFCMRPGAVLIVGDNSYETENSCGGKYIVPFDIIFSGILFFIVSRYFT